jgi:hypothetical protein
VSGIQAVVPFAVPQCAEPRSTCDTMARNCPAPLTGGRTCEMFFSVAGSEFSAQMGGGVWWCAVPG